MPTVDEKIFIPSPAAEPFDIALLRACRACDLKLTWWDQVLRVFKGAHPNVSKVNYCPGGKAPTENRGLLSAMMTGDVEAFNPCAGIDAPHLHVRCNQCGFSFLMRTRTPNVKAS